MIVIDSVYVPIHKQCVLLSNAYTYYTYSQGNLRTLSNQLVPRPTSWPVERLWLKTSVPAAERSNRLLMPYQLIPSGVIKHRGFHRKITDKWYIFQHAMFDSRRRKPRKVTQGYRKWPMPSLITSAAMISISLTALWICLCPRHLSLAVHLHVVDLAAVAAMIVTHRAVAPHAGLPSHLTELDPLAWARPAQPGKISG